LRNPFHRGFLRLGLIACGCVVCADLSQGQEPKSELPEAPVATSSAGPSATEDIELSWKQLPKRILNDQKDIWLFPVQLAKGRHWIPTLVTVGGTAGLIVADPHAMPYFQTHAGNLDDFNDVFDGPITNAEIAIVPATFFLIGQIRHNSYASKTGLLAGEAYADGYVVSLAIKAITRRKRPSEVAAGPSFNDTFFNSRKSPFGTSFPSGHAIEAFSVATVVAHRYGRHRWVPWIAYGAATVISLSRVTTRAHFPSDVFLGAALGYSIARFEVLRH
jgi:membrane-associated phospholipid phosphatase